jgi:hypothetical protein
MRVSAVWSENFGLSTSDLDDIAQSNGFGILNLDRLLRRADRQFLSVDSKTASP